MAGMKTWVPGEEVKSVDLNGYIQTQTVPVFTTAAQRDAQWPSPPDGAVCTLLDSHFTMMRSGGQWRILAPCRTVTATPMSADFVSPPSTNLTAYQADFGGGGPDEDVTVHVMLALSQASGLGVFDVTVAGGPLPFTQQYPNGAAFAVMAFPLIIPGPTPNPIQLRVSVNTWGAKAVTVLRASSSVAVYTRNA